MHDHDPVIRRGWAPDGRSPMRRVVAPRRAGLRRMIAGAVLCLIQACSATSPEEPGAEPGPPAPTVPPEFQKGITFLARQPGDYASEAADRSLANLAATGANWVALVVTGHQVTYASTAIRRDPPETPTDAELIHAIDRAHELGLRVMLEPRIELSDDPSHRRSDIGDAFPDETLWLTWFTSYQRFINHYAALARDSDVEQLSVGAGLVSTSHREGDWRTVIRGVREIFPGPITYASESLTEAEAIGWWDALDYIGVDLDDPLTTERQPSVDALRAAWTGRGDLDRLGALSERHARPILLTRLGYRSVEGAAATPPDPESEPPPDLQAQADAYQAALEAFWGRPWLAGMYWWAWDTDPTAGGAEDRGYTPYRKPAEAVLRSFYRGPATVATP